MKRKREDLEQELSYRSAEAIMFHTAMSDVMAGEHKLVGRFTDDGVSVTVWLVGALRRDGGTLLIKQAFRTGQAPDYHVVGLEKQRDHLARHSHGNYASLLFTLTGKALRMVHEMQESESQAVTA
jgi:hypothetical protein